jgi:hypothetical protein
MENEPLARQLLDLENKQAYLDSGYLTLEDIDKVEHDTMRSMRFAKADIRAREEEKREMMQKLAATINGKG